MGFGTGPEPLEVKGVVESSHWCSLSKFAATQSPVPQSLSAVEGATSEIIDANSNANYAFWEVPVVFSIQLFLVTLGFTPNMFV